MTKRKDFEARMRSLEWFHRERVLPGLWLIVRLDGRAFGHFTAARFGKPFDPRLRDLICGTARALLLDFQGLYAYTMSDEISLLLPREWDLFGRVVEKVVSISAGVASAAFTQACGEPAHFDSRVCLGVNEEAVIDYFRWRQADAARNALHSWCYWTLRKSGVSTADAVRQLDRSTVSFKTKLLSRHGITFDQVPAWQRRGVGIYWEDYKKEGYDPVAQRAVIARRRRLKVNMDLPIDEAYDALLRHILRPAPPSAS
jgi:tRNA(His) 5'-end guanylyltransferase